ncbi:hypothetical protein EYR41_000308 [Orbilia oligospora]|uniref:Uncharacterized protein n=1 Tax=Orbilia oligospora TaxID=2813651 RepID=A0A7C8TRU8_ORBOL|nr:hypothetical protein TWF751_001372 [Orbilia oligospora]TGJ73201.1 hypothetical protein EYR41_000308 [Orbilia oligospora]
MPYQHRFGRLGPFPKWLLILILVSPNIPFYNLVEAAPLSTDDPSETSLASFSSVSTIFDTSIGTSITNTQANFEPGPTTHVRVFSNESSLLTKTISFTSAVPSPKSENPARDLPSYKINSTDSTDETPTRTDKRYGDIIGPQWFYKDKIAVECPTVETILGLDMSGIDRTHFPGSEDLVLPVRYADTFASVEQARPYIEIGVLRCKDCDCVNDGTMIPNWFRGTDGVCKTDRDVSICQLVYGCYCSARLTQRQPTSTSLTADDYQNALDQIPYSVRVDSRNIGYWWKDAPVNAQGRRAWMKAPDGYVPGFTYNKGSRHRELAPGTNEPFYLEGPEDNYQDVPFNRDATWGLSTGKGSGLFNKRDSVTPANLRGDGKVTATKTQPAFEEDNQNFVTE